MNKTQEIPKVVVTEFGLRGENTTNPYAEVLGVAQVLRDVRDTLHGDRWFSQLELSTTWFGPPPTQEPVAVSITFELHQA